MSLRSWTATFAGGVLARGMYRLNARHPWSHNDHFHSWIVSRLPEPCDAVLDVGCGRGELVAALAPHVTRVIGNDTDATMRDQATRRCGGLDNTEIVGGEWNETTGPFDAVTMIAALHHLDLEPALHDVRNLLAPGGRFLSVGLARPQSPRDHLWDVASMVTNPMIGYVKHPWPSKAPGAPAPFPVRDPDLTFDQVRDVLERVMPGATIRRRLAFRHTIEWTKPSGG